MSIFTHLAKLLLRFFYAHNFAAIFLLVLIEEAGVPIPIPGDTLVMIAGARPHRSIPYDVGMILTASAAVFLGSSLLYFLVRSKGRPLLDRYGRYIHFKQNRLEALERWFRRRGSVVIIFGRLIPGLRVPTTVMAGLSGIPYSTYAPTAAVAAIFWSVFYFFAGLLIRHAWATLAGLIVGILDLDDVSIAILLILLAVVMLGGWFAVRRGRSAWRLRKQRQPMPAQRPQSEIQFVSEERTRDANLRSERHPRRA